MGRRVGINLAFVFAGRIQSRKKRRDVQEVTTKLNPRTVSIQESTA